MNKTEKGGGKQEWMYQQQGMERKQQGVCLSVPNGESYRQRGRDSSPSMKSIFEGVFGRLHWERKIMS